MTSTNLHLTIVLSLIGINTIGAVLYFFYGFFKTVKTGKAVPQEQFVIFDYKKRDFLYYSARTIVFTENEMEQAIEVM